MIRTQIQLEPHQASRIKQYSNAEGISMAEAIRRLVEIALPEEVSNKKDLYRRASTIVGFLASPDGETDLSINHDDYLEDAFK